jgi:hypothetical protein
MKNRNWIELALKIIGVGLGFFILFHAFRMVILFLLFLING